MNKSFIGDKLIILNDETKEKEEREVTMVLSNKSLGIKEAFDRDIGTFTSFKYQKKPKVKEKEKPVEQLVEEELKKVNKIYGDDSTREKGKTTLEYRERAGPWTYKKVTKEVEGQLTREEELDLRVKKGRDKYCWF